MIDDPIAARRLARAICTDVQLYNDSKIRGIAPADGMRALEEPLREGMQLYVSRVSPELRPLFHDAAREMCERLGIPYHPISDVPLRVARSEPMPMPAAHPPVPQREPAPAGGVPPTLVMAIAVACTIFGAAVFFFLSH